MSVMFAITLVVWICSVATVIPQVVALPQRRFVDILNQRRHTTTTTTTDETLVSTNDNDDNDVQELYLSQRLDHFDVTNPRRFSQRYFQSRRYEQPNATHHFAFLCVGGEGPGFTKAVLMDSVHCTGDMLELARKLSSSLSFSSDDDDDGDDDSNTSKPRISISLYALEHRYYGASYPDFGNGTSPVSNKHLKYLSSRQALEDLAHFVQHIQQQHTVSSSSTTQWVTFGGSYPGFMAAQARLRYPHLIHAAVSSSAPLDLKVDFPQYNQHVAWDLQYSKIGGSDECLDIVQKGHAQAVEWLMQPDTTVELAHLFHVCDPETALTNHHRANQDLLVGDGLIGIYVQGNDPSCQNNDWCNVDRLCHLLLLEKRRRQTYRHHHHHHHHHHGTNDTEEEDSLELKILAQVAQEQRNGDDDDDDDECITVDWQETLKELSKPMVENSGMRSWLWQTCTEFGFYQTCRRATEEEEEEEEDELDNGTSSRKPNTLLSCPFAIDYHLVDMDLEICKVAFNITNVYENVQASMDHYGGLNIQSGSRVLSVNGNVDPWSELAVEDPYQHKKEDTLPVKIVPGASHHYWTHPVKETDAPEIVEAREYIYSVVMGWLGITTREDDSTPIGDKDVEKPMAEVVTLRGSLAGSKE